MNSSTKDNLIIGSIIVATATAAAALGYYFSQRKKVTVIHVTETPAPGSQPEPVQGKNDKETLQTSSVQSDPEEISNATYEHYTRLSGFLNDSSNLVKQLLVSKQVRPLNINGNHLIENAEVLMDLNQMPAKFVSKRRSEKLTVYFGYYKPTESTVLLIQDGEANFVLSMPHADRFVANGPVFEDISTFGYLESLLGALVEQWGLE
jgi:hypothetical protein